MYADTVRVFNFLKSQVSKRMIPVSTMVNVWQEIKVFYCSYCL